MTKAKHNYEVGEGVTVVTTKNALPATVSKTTTLQVLIKFDKTIVIGKKHGFEIQPNAAEIKFTVRKDGSVKQSGGKSHLEHERRYSPLDK